MKKFINKSSYGMLALASLLSITFLILILSLFDIDSPEKYIPIVTATVALYTPFGAYKIAEKWREQKKYELRRDYIIKALEQISIIRAEVCVVAGFAGSLERNLDFSTSSSDFFKDLTIINNRAAITKIYAPMKIIDALDSTKLLLTDKYAILENHIFALRLRSIAVAELHEKVINTNKESIIESAYAMHRLKKILNEIYYFGPVEKKKDDSLYVASKYLDIAKITLKILNEIEDNLVGRISKEK